MGSFEQLGGPNATDFGNGCPRPQGAIFKLGLKGADVGRFCQEYAVVWTQP